MSTNVTNLGRSGLYDWVVQRATAVILGAYFIVLMGFFILEGQLEYEVWRAFMACMPMKVATIITLLSIAAHGWIGMWTISTDYLNRRGHLPVIGDFSVPTFVKMSFQGFCVLLLIASVLWGTLLIWGL